MSCLRTNSTEVQEPQHKKKEEKPIKPNSGSPCCLCGSSQVVQEPVGRIRENQNSKSTLGESLQPHLSEQGKKEGKGIKKNSINPTAHFMESASNLQQEGAESVIRKEQTQSDLKQDPNIKTKGQHLINEVNFEKNQNEKSTPEEGTYFHLSQQGEQENSDLKKSRINMSQNSDPATQLIQSANNLQQEGAESVIRKEQTQSDLKQEQNINTKQLSLINQVNSENTNQVDKNNIAPQLINNTTNNIPTYSQVEFSQSLHLPKEQSKIQPRFLSQKQGKTNQNQLQNYECIKFGTKPLSSSHSSKSVAEAHDEKCILMQVERLLDNPVPFVLNDNVLISKIQKISEEEVVFILSQYSKQNQQEIDYKIHAILTPNYENTRSIIQKYKGLKVQQTCIGDQYLAYVSQNQNLSQSS